MGTGDCFVVDLEGHGREDIFEGIDLSRTVGWFTTIFPFRLETAHSDPGVALTRTKERLAQVPDRGLSYGLQRYLGDREARAALGAQPQPDVVFNYLGQFDQVVAGSSLFGFAPESPGPWHSPSARRRHALEIVTVVREGRLEARFIFNETLHRPDTIERIARGFIDSLRELIRHCEAATAPRFRPSDFALAGLDEAGLERLVRAYPGLDDVYPLTPMQRLFHSVAATPSAGGLEQWRFEIAGPLDPACLRDAWSLLLERHAILRTAFTTEASAEPLQVVERSVDLPWREEDLRGRQADEQEAHIRAIVEQELSRGLDLAHAPLLRLILVRLDEDRYDLLWTTHHLYIDGWSWPILFKDLAAVYGALRAGLAPTLPKACSYGSYIRWLSQRPASSEAFWRTELAGLEEPTPLDLGLPTPDADRRLGSEPEAGDEEVLALSLAETEQLQSLARAQQVTLSSVVQAAWALVLSHYSGLSDVVFGAAFSGRPPELPGIDQLVGPCVNDVPVSARIAHDEPVAVLLTQLQQRQPELSQHQYDPLAEIQSWTGVPPRLRLFESLIVFQNYVVDEAALRLGPDTRIRLVSGPDATDYPVTLVVVPGQHMRFKLLSHSGRFPRAQGTTMLRDLWTVLEAIATQPGATAASVLERIPEETRGKATTVASPARRLRRPRTSRRSDRSRKASRLSGASFSRSIGSGWTTTSSTWVDIRCSSSAHTSGSAQRSIRRFRSRPSSRTRRCGRWPAT